MKPRWHFLFLIISGAIASYLWFNLQKPVWELADPRILSFAKTDPVKKEWHCIVHDQEKQEYWYETRSGRDPKVVRKLRISLPATSYPFYADGSPLLIDSHALLGYEYVLTGKAGNPKLELRYSLFDENGKVLRRFTLMTNPLGQITGYRNKLAFFEKGDIVLYDLVKNEERKVKMSQCQFLSFSPDGKLLACQSRFSGSLSFIDWNALAVNEVIPDSEAVHCYRFVSRDDVLIGCKVESDQVRYRRYHWDGVKLQASTPGFTLQNHVFFPSIKTPSSGLLHVCAWHLKGWPLRWKSILEWLESNKYPVERWFPKAYYSHFHVLNAQDQIVDEYYESQSLAGQHALYEQLYLERLPQKEGTTYRLWNHAPRWPNALAAGMLVYLAGYVATRCWRNN